MLEGSIPLFWGTYPHLILEVGDGATHLHLVALCNPGPERVAGFPWLSEKGGPRTNLQLLVELQGQECYVAVSTDFMKVS